MLCMSQRLIDNLPVQSLPDILTSLVRTSFDEKLEVCVMPSGFGLSSVSSVWRSM